MILCYVNLGLGATTATEAPELMSRITDWHQRELTDGTDSKVPPSPGLLLWTD